MCNLDYDPADFYVEKLRVAKKVHNCCECFREILPGESYKYVFGVWGEFKESFKTCRFCRIPQDWLYKECNGFAHGNLYKEIMWHAIEYRKIFLYRWVVQMRRKWR